MAILVGIVAFSSSGAVGVLVNVPAPRIHDEFSYLLAADTFSHWRITNPTHPMWIHFETMHVIHQPTYMSKYPPAQGLFLAVGQLATGYPIVGVWISMGSMCGAIYWMLRVWVSRRWALLGAFLAVFHPVLGIAGDWAQSYWGGAVAATGGALVLGGMRKLIQKTTAGSAILLGIGVALLANSRPYEGLLLCLPVAARLLYWMTHEDGPAISVSATRILMPLFLIIGLTAAGMAYYNFKITGDALRLPYQVHEKTYAIVPNFIWQDLRPAPRYHHPVIKDFHAHYGFPTYREKQTFLGFIKINLAVWALYTLFAGGVMVLPLVGVTRIFVLWILRNKWACFATLIYAVFALGISTETYSYLHYFAPIMPLNYYFILQAMRLCRKRVPRVGKIVVCTVPSLAIAMLAINVRQGMSDKDALAPHLQRARLLAELSHGESRHLILVKFGPKHSYDREWVSNEADIDGAKVVWARAMDPMENCKLIEYFKDRTIWSVEIDDDRAPIKLNHFPEQSCQGVDSSTASAP